MTHAVMQELSDGYSSESGALYALLTPLAEARWNQPTQFKEWTLNDILAHLAFFDCDPVHELTHGAFIPHRGLST